MAERRRRTERTVRADASFVTLVISVLLAVCGGLMIIIAVVP